ncbi:MAG: hypothetical protein IJ079_11475 [Lachnospiraceae bacterium]|nr:hypothetical protein [Lachnospiraceae bacterium]
MAEDILIQDSEGEDSMTESGSKKGRKELPPGLKVVGYILTALIAILAISYLASVLWFQIRIRPIRIDPDTVIEEVRISGVFDMNGESVTYDYSLTDQDSFQQFIQVTGNIRANRVIGYEGYEVMSNGRCGVWITYEKAAGNDQTEYFLVDGNVLKIEDSSDPMYHMTEDACQNWWNYIEWLYQLNQVGEG